jgi:hypothetical protein
VNVAVNRPKGAKKIIEKKVITAIANRNSQDGHWGQLTKTHYGNTRDKGHGRN